MPEVYLERSQIPDDLMEYFEPADCGRCFVCRMVEVFREVRRVLAPHGTCWVNLGDSYNAGTGGRQPSRDVEKAGDVGYWQKAGEMGDRRIDFPGLKVKDLCGIPWRVAFALQADGWYLRSDIIWAKPNPMPESVTDRPTKAHEYVFLLSKQPRYFFDQEAVREAITSEHSRVRYKTGAAPTRYGKSNDDNFNRNDRGRSATVDLAAGRNIRSVWPIATQPYPEAHFATFPEELARRCIAAGCPEQVCRVCNRPGVREVVRTPLGSGPSVDPTPLTGRKGMNRIRKPDEGTREITKAEQRDYARQLRESPHRDEMAAEAGEAFAHYIRTDDSGARPVPPNLLNEWLDRGWLAAAEASDCGHSDYRPGIVLDPFMGSGTVAHVARKLGRHAVGIDLNADYLALAARRLQQQSLFAEAAS